MPAGWQAVENSECVTISGKNLLSAVQISAARNEAGLVTDEDLKDFAAERLGDQTSLCQINTPIFTGFYAEYIKKDTFWREWWLRSGDLMVYVTYNVDIKYRGTEMRQVDEIVRSLRPFKCGNQ